MDSLSKKDALAVKKIMKEFDSVLGIMEHEKGTIDDEIESKIAEREEARKNKDFEKADNIRDALKEKGIILEDTPQGVRWKKV